MDGHDDSSANKRGFSDLSPVTTSPSTHHEDKKLNQSATPPPPMIVPEDCDLPEDTPPWAKLMLSKIENLRTDVNTSINFTHEIAEEASHKSTENEKRIEKLESENMFLKEKLKALEERVVKQESYSRRDNLLLHGIQEKKGENCGDIVLDTLSKIGINLPQRAFVRVHRNPPGPYTPGKNRPIIAKFHHFQDRQAVWQSRKNLPGELYITEDFPKEISQRRRNLTPILALAKTVPTVKAARLVEDKLLLDGTVYTTDKLHTLPEEIRSKSTSTLTKDGVVAFSSASAPLSNLYPCDITMQGHKYSSVEHYYCLQKAKHAMIQEAIDDINANPTQARKIGKAIRMQPALYAEWKRIRCDILKTAIRAKFTQNSHLATILKETGNSIIVEATRDRYWGAGRTLTDPAIFTEKTWKGRNVCGNLIMEVRSEL